MRRGLTLVETLGAIALLGALAAVSAQWITTALRISNETSGKLTWEQAAHRTLGLIARDIAIGDQQGDPKAWIDDGALVIKTRVSPTLSTLGGAVTRRYIARTADGVAQFVCQVEPDRRSMGSQPIEEERVLLGALTGFKVEIVDVEGDFRLFVTLVSRHATLKREFDL